MDICEVIKLKNQSTSLNLSLSHLSLEFSKFESADYLDVFCSQLLFKGVYISSYCCMCNTEFLPNEVRVKSWSFGEGLYASGGKSLYCKKGHLLFEMDEWNS